MDLTAFKKYVKANQTVVSEFAEKKLPKVQAEETGKEKRDSSLLVSSKSQKKQSITRKNHSGESKRHAKWENNSRTKRKYSSRGGSHEDSQTVISSVMRLSKSRGSLLGTSNGKTLLAVESKTGADVKLKVREDEIKIMISGTRGSVNRAETMIKNLTWVDSAPTAQLPPVDPAKETTSSSVRWEKVNKRRRSGKRTGDRGNKEAHPSPDGQRNSRPDEHLTRERKRLRTSGRRPPEYTRIKEQVVFNPNSPLGFALEDGSRVVVKIIAGSEAACKGVQKGWEIRRVGGIPVSPHNVRSTLSMAVKAKKKFLINFLLPSNERVNRESPSNSKREPSSKRSGSKVDFRSLSYKGVCQILRRSGVEALERVADIFEKEEIDGEDLTTITFLEISKLLPKLGMRKKLQRFMAKLGYHLPMSGNVNGSSRHSSTSKRKSELLQLSNLPEDNVVLNSSSSKQQKSGKVRGGSRSLPSSSTSSKRKLTSQTNLRSTKRRKPTDIRRDSPLDTRHRKHRNSSERRKKLFCIHCGDLIPPIAMFCAGCGKRVKSYT